MSLGKHCRLGALSALVFALDCGGGGISAPVAPNPTQPIFGHVFLLVEENHSYSEVTGNSDMPYLNSVASQFGLATQYYANVHPSIGNYFMLTTGKVESLDDSFSGTVDDDNMVRELVKAGKSWKCYAESLPSAGYTGADSYPYLKHHNPFAYLSDVVSTSQADNLVPFTQFSADLASAALPNFSFIVPNALNDAHDGSLAQADDWLKEHIDPLVSSSAFQNDGLLIIVFDESETSDVSHGGGHVPAAIIGGKVKKGFQSSTVFQHQSTLRLILSVLGVAKFPGASATASDMSGFFQ
jgi:phosphatidylinositol-3-phosphatase